MAPGTWSPGAGAGAELTQAGARLAHWHHGGTRLTTSRSLGPTHRATASVDLGCGLGTRIF